ncbi:MAG: Rieske 2Fe-2S domain-containing protein [Egibacteraceae bacterium]
MSAEIHWLEATTLDELWEGEILDVELEGEPVLLVHLLGGDVQAYQGVCPHQEVSLADGDWDEESAVLVCSGHHWEFDMRAGAGINPAGCRLYSYPVQIAGESVRVGIPQDGERHYNRCAGM